MMFADRNEAGKLLAERLKKKEIKTYSIQNKNLRRHEVAQMPCQKRGAAARIV